MSAAAKLLLRPLGSLMANFLIVVLPEAEHTSRNSREWLEVAVDGLQTLGELGGRACGGGGAGVALEAQSVGRH